MRRDEETTQPVEQKPEARAQAAQAARPAYQAPRLSVEQGDKQEAEYREAITPKLQELKAPGSEKGEPGASPFHPITGEAASELFFADPVLVQGERWVWDQTAYGAPVRHYY